MRRSNHINRRPASNIHHAIRIAEYIGLPLNLMVTINFAMTACGGEGASSRFAKLRTNYFGKWVTRPGRNSGLPSAPPTFVWSLENGGNVLAVHWLVHVPKIRWVDFERLLYGWIETVAGEITASNAVLVKPAPTPRGAGKYTLKGIDPLYAAFYGVTHIPQGVVLGRRSGMSRNIGPSVKIRLRRNGEYRVAKWSRTYPGAPPMQKSSSVH